MISAKLVDAGMDWLTITTKDQARSAEWKMAFDACASKEQARGFKWSEQRLLGYVGEGCGHLFWGKRTDGAMMRLTSGAAQEFGWLFSPEACHVTRIDLQVTAELEYALPAFLPKAYEHVRARPVANGRPPVYTLLQNTLGGSTLYIGSRSSMRYGRVYDKGQEDGTAVPGKRIRWELEVKDVLADQACAMLAHSADEGRSILGLVGSFFTERGVPVLWSVPSHEERFVVPRITPDDAGSLKWLRGPVAGTVERLMHTVGARQTLAAIFSKAFGGSSDSDIIENMAMVLEN